jgi:hypothetical protein
MSYRLHIDIPISDSDLETARAKAGEILSVMITQGTPQAMDILHDTYGVKQINYRLGHDDDRQRSNYFEINKNGHANNKKSSIKLTSNIK